MALLALTVASLSGCPSTEAPSVDPDVTADSAADTSQDAPEVQSGDVADTSQDAPDIADAGDTGDAEPEADTTPDASEVADSDVTTDTAGDVAEEISGDVAEDVDPDQSETTSDITQTNWGPIQGPSCGGISDALTSTDPSFHVTTWTFEAATFDPAILGPGPMSRYEELNAGGSSKCSEVMSMTWLMECQAGSLYKKETDIIYDINGAITDYAMTVDGNVIGVSVTRAYLGPFNQDYTLADATTLLDKKLEGVNESTLNVSAGDAWTKQILHIWTLQPDWVPILEEAWMAMDAGLKADTVVLVTIEDGSDYIVTDSCDD